MGLAQWIKIGVAGRPLVNLEVPYDKVEERFAEMTGLPFRQAEKIFYNQEGRLLRRIAREQGRHAVMEYQGMREAEYQLLRNAY